MVYCEKCRVKNGWPEREVIWLATCRVCGRRGPCYDTPSDELPPLTSGKGPKRAKSPILDERFDIN
jgi:hypothetical protein